MKPLPCMTILLLAFLQIGQIRCDTLALPHRAEPEIAFHWNLVEYEWPNATFKQEAIDSGRYVPQNVSIQGIKVYNGKVYVTTPRLKPGIPSTLNLIVENPSSDKTSVSHVLRPYPNWDWQTVGDCNQLQIVQSMEIDPATGYMWIVDTGHKSEGDISVSPIDVCPPKIVIYDIENNTTVHRYTIPKMTIGYGLYYLNDVVLDYYNGSARYAYISDTLDYKLVVYDYLEDRSYAYSHRNMEADSNYENITISNITLPGIITGINGMAMSSDFKYLYYSSVAGVDLHQIETSVLKTAEGNTGSFAAAVRTVGSKVSPGDGMVYGSKNNLYYSALTSNAIYKWDIAKDLDTKKDFNKVQLTTHSELVSDPLMDWVDTLAIDEHGYLWFTTSRLNKFFSADGIVKNESNFFVWKYFVDDTNYMTLPKKTDDPTLGAGTLYVSFAVLIACLISSAVFKN